ncbi:hypothetical protein BOTBODRAFT_269574 [Botryobasidium botryosum FD-172 SS1]|uniref:Uncharacterized protein n=1 Tax=Botryobasidium botryosum (strain FD-172 SS1) TaxID=930990 RepID=A0A067MX70_BOTB1|nr:hypothetical protein BOTBODRAFT_269574 [Botryobasidium botryosum FD-172 SS1]
MKVSARKIRTWEMSGTLVGGIKEAFGSWPQLTEGPYYAWFLKNEWVLDRSVDPPSDPHDEVTRRGWVYAAGNPSLSTTQDIMAIVKHWPENKALLLLFCGGLLSHIRPHQNESLWVKLGFCACHDEGGQALLAMIYTVLTTKCPFEEFCAAYDGGSLIALLDAYGFKATRERITYLEDALAGPPGTNKSVWDLKQAISVEEGDVTPSVSVDYGFAKCRNTLEALVLREMYREFFLLPDANPLQLHEAAMRGQLFEYLGGLISIKRKDRKMLQRVMKTPHSVAK